MEPFFPRAPPSALGRVTATAPNVRARAVAQQAQQQLQAAAQQHSASGDSCTDTSDSVARGAGTAAAARRGAATQQAQQQQRRAGDAAAPQVHASVPPLGSTRTTFGRAAPAAPLPQSLYQQQVQQGQHAQYPQQGQYHAQHAGQVGPVAAGMSNADLLCTMLRQDPQLLKQFLMNEAAGLGGSARSLPSVLSSHPSDAATTFAHTGAVRPMGGPGMSPTAITSTHYARTPSFQFKSSMLC